MFLIVVPIARVHQQEQYRARYKSIASQCHAVSKSLSEQSLCRHGHRLWKKVDRCAPSHGMNETPPRAYYWKNYWQGMGKQTESRTNVVSCTPLLFEPNRLFMIVTQAPHARTRRELGSEAFKPHGTRSPYNLTWSINVLLQDAAPYPWALGTLDMAATIHRYAL
jgi:hypothetical protein